MKLVRYNGLKESYMGCDSPKNLTLGKTYIVEGENDLGYQTNLTLQGVPGEYNSVWFDEVRTKPVYEGFIRKIPQVSMRCEGYRVENNKVVSISTSRVESVERLSGNTYRVVTRNSVYYMRLINWESYCGRYPLTF